LRSGRGILGKIWTALSQRWKGWANRRRKKSRAAAEARFVAGNFRGALRAANRHRRLDEETRDLILIRAVANLKLNKPVKALQIVDAFFEWIRSAAPSLAFVGAHAAAALKDKPRTAELLVRATTMFPGFLEEAEGNPVFKDVIASLNLREKMRDATSTNVTTGYG